MMIVPIYDMLILPEIVFYFKKDVFEKLGCGSVQKDEEILFAMMKSDKERVSLTDQDFYPVGISARIESIDEDGNYRIHTGSRVDFSDFEISWNPCGCICRQPAGKIRSDR